MKFWSIWHYCHLKKSQEITNWSLFKRTWAPSINLIALKMKDEPCLGFIQRLIKYSPMYWAVLAGVINSQTPHKAMGSKNSQPLLCSQLHFGFLSGTCITCHNSCPVPKSVLFILHRKCYWLMIDWRCTSAGCTCVSYWNTEDFHIEIIEIFHISFLHPISGKEVSDREISAKNLIKSLELRFILPWSCWVCISTGLWPAHVIVKRFLSSFIIP